MSTKKPSGVDLGLSAPIAHRLSAVAATETRVVGLLLLYSNSYSEQSIHFFSKLLDAVDKKNTLIIILNQPLIIPHINHSDLHIINGDNELREFSGWNVGVQYCRKNKLLPNHGIIIFGNDTFCHHNKYGPMTQFLFAQTFRKMLKRCDKLLIAGEIQSNPTELIIFSLKFREWISTYLYAMTVPLLDNIKGVVPDDELSQCFRSSMSQEEFFTHHVNRPLAEKLTSWLFGIDGNSKWHGAQKLSTSNHLFMLGKAKSILCEMHLSAKSMHVGAQLIPVFKSGFARQIRRLERLL